MPPQLLLPAPLDPALGSREVHSCRQCEQHIAIAERELCALVTAVRGLFGDAEANRVAEDWIGLAEDPNAVLAAGFPVWRGLRTAAIEQLAERWCPRQLQHRQGD
jgi:hypothetical protein